jgi:hypothetical protein
MPIVMIQNRIFFIRNLATILVVIRHSRIVHWQGLFLHHGEMLNYLSLAMRDKYLRMREKKNNLEM